QIIWRQLLSAAKPLVYDVSVLVIHLKIAPVCMKRRNHWRFGMDDQTQSAGEKIDIAHAEHFLHRIGQFAMDARNVYAAFLKHVSVFDDTRSSAASFGTFPNILAELCHTVDLLKSGADLVLEGLDVAEKCIFHLTLNWLQTINWL